MDFFYSTEIAIPISQIVLMLALSTIALFFGKLKVGLLINYLFALYWGYISNRDELMKLTDNAELYIYMYFGFGLFVIIFAMIGFVFQQRQ